MIWNNNQFSKDMGKVKITSKDAIRCSAFFRYFKPDLETNLAKLFLNGDDLKNPSW